jgi:CoA:oxalate CoA-transferase
MGNKVFSDVKILDFCQVISGSYATMMMADMGAYVLKVEPPVIGDSMRLSGPKKEGESTFFIHLNRNKKSICIDLKKEEGKEIIRKLIPQFDIISENFKPGVMEKLGFGYEDVKKIKEDIIYLSVSGYGHNNSYSDRPAYDNMIQAETGLAYINGLPNDDTPIRSPLSVSDYTTGMYGGFSLATAIYHHRRTKQGQHIDLAMYDSLISIMDNSFLLCDTHKEQIQEGVDLKVVGLEKVGNRHPGTAPHGYYKTKDGYIAHMSLTNNMWETLLGLMKKDGIEMEEEYKSAIIRQENWSKIDKVMERWTVLYTNKELEQIFNDNRLPFGRVRKVDEVYADEHNKERGIFNTLDHPKAGKVEVHDLPPKFSETPAAIDASSPNLGEHSRLICKEILEFSDEKIEQLLRDNVLFTDDY